MSYENFAYVYDALMEDAPYPQWLQWVKQQRERHGVKGRRMLDLACGTGELSLLLAREGFEVTGVDLSEDMLTVASGKALAEGAHLTFLQQDMRALCGLHDFDMVTIFCDSLNYLETETEVKETFRHVHAALKAGECFCLTCIPFIKQMCYSLITLLPITGMRFPISGTAFRVSARMPLNMISVFSYMMRNPACMNVLMNYINSGRFRLLIMKTGLRNRASMLCRPLLILQKKRPAQKVKGYFLRASNDKSILPTQNAFFEKNLKKKQE